MRLARTPRVAALLAAALLATACGGAADTAAPADGVDAIDSATQDDPQETPEADTPDADAPDDAGEDAPAAEGQPQPSAEAIAALDFTTVDLDGEAFVGREFAGQDVLLWIWAPWCSVCNREAPKIRPVLADYADDLVVLGLPGKDDVAAHQGFVSEHDLGFMRHIVDQDGSIWSRYGVGYQPAFVFIDGSGAISVHPGAIGADELAERLAALVDA